MSTQRPRNGNEMTPEQRSIALMHLFGWQGGTIHQVAEKTGCKASEILHGMAQGDVMGGFSAARTCSREFNERVNFPRAYGNLDFWIGAAFGQWLHENGVPSFSKQS